MLFAQLLANGIFIGSIYALLGLSFATIFAGTKIWHFAHGAVYTLGGYALLVMSGRTHLPFSLAVVAAVFFCAALGALTLAGLYVPLQRRGATPLVMVMASLGVMIVVDNLLLLWFGPSGFSIDVTVPDPVIIGGIFLTGGQALTPLIAAIVVAAYFYFLYRTVRGQQLRALIDNEELLLLNGVYTDGVKRLAFACGSGLLPIATALFVASGSGIAPNVGVSAVLIGAMAMFLGGVDTIAGAALAGLLLGIVESLSAYFFPTEWQTAVTYALALLFLMIRPTGLFGRSLPRASV
jgi:branched-chain amino acid transport system permease protein